MTVDMVPRKIIDGYPVDVPASSLAVSSSLSPRDTPVYSGVILNLYANDCVEFRTCCRLLIVFRCCLLYLMIPVRLLLVVVLVRVMMIPGSMGINDSTSVPCSVPCTYL